MLSLSEPMGARRRSRRSRTVPTILRGGGLLALVVGLLLSAVGLLDLVASLASFEIPGAAWTLLAGLPLVAVGAAVARAGYLRPTSRAIGRNVAPIARETLDYLGASPDRHPCERCGGLNSAESPSCETCGARLGAACHACGKQNGPVALFCERCRVPLRHHPLAR